MPRRVVERATAQALSFLASQQQPDGSFSSHSSPTLEPFRATRTYRTTFTPALILGALAAVPGHPALVIRQRLADWLATQKSPDGSYNYWAANAPERTSLPYPDDLDDTFCAAISLHRHDPSLVDAAAQAQLVRLLLATESAVGGPYYTWLVAKDAPPVWRDIDLAVNSNIACFLGLIAGPLPTLTSLMSSAIATGKLHSPYYPSWHAVAYYLARACPEASKAALDRYISQRRAHGHWGSPLKTALALSALQHLGGSGDLATAVSYLLDQQQPDGSWAAAAFCLDPARRGQTHYSGTAALTTALVVEALQPTHPAGTIQLPVQTAGIAKNRSYQKVWAMARYQLTHLRPELQQRAVRALDQMSSGSNGQEIVLLPALFAGSLRQTFRPLAHLLPNLSLANAYGWTAYTLYDDFLDGDSQDLALLLVANLTMRHSLAAFRRALPGQPGFQRLVLETFDAIDGANAWELTHCRCQVQAGKLTVGTLPRYGNSLSLADRSLGHTLTPLGVLTAAGLDPTSVQARQVTLALRHYLAARQLNDDLHDWQADLQAGQCSYVVTALLRSLRIRPGTHSIQRLLPRMQRQFWHRTLPSLCGVIQRHTILARRATARSRLLATPNAFEGLLDAIDASVHHTLAEHRQAKDFLAAYDPTTE